MSRKTNAVSDRLYEACKAELKKQGIRGETGRRLQAIISAKQHGIKAVSKIYGISRSTLMRWIARYGHGGVESFAVQAGRGRRCKLNAEQEMEIKKHVEKHGATLSSKELSIFVNKTFNVCISVITAYRLLKKLRFSYITPRPIHYKQNTESHEKFKKKSGRTSKRRR